MIPSQKGNFLQLALWLFLGTTVIFYNPLEILDLIFEDFQFSNFQVSFFSLDLTTEINKTKGELINFCSIKQLTKRQEVFKIFAVDYWQ